MKIHLFLAQEAGALLVGISKRLVKKRQRLVIGFVAIHAYAQDGLGNVGHLLGGMIQLEVEPLHIGRNTRIAGKVGRRHLS